jgi:hypothetical protein
MKQLLNSLVVFSILLSCNNNNNAGDDKSSIPEKGMEVEDMNDYRIKADSIVAKTFDTLRNTLQAAVKDKGFDGAVAFCNINALAITNTYAAQGISIKRTSDKLRNPANLADSMEQRILTFILNQPDLTSKTGGLVELDASGRVHYFKPIIMQSMCLNCHGNKDQIQQVTMESIQSKYPADAAIGYREGDVRGLWHVAFGKN